MPVTKSGYQFTTPEEYREALWLVEQGDYKSLDDYGKASEAVDKKFRKMIKEEKKRKKKKKRKKQLKKEKKKAKQLKKQKEQD